MPDQTPLDQTAAIIRDRKQEFLDKWGSLEITVAPDNPLAQAGIGEIHGIRIHEVEGVVFLGDGDETPLAGGMLHFHPADAPGFGSQALDDDGGYWGDDE